MIGKTIRLNRILNPADRRALCVAADHGFMLGPTNATRQLQKTLESVISGGPDAVLLSPGQARHMAPLFENRNAPALLIRADWISGPRIMEHAVPVYSLEEFLVIEAGEALAIGADGVVIYYITGFSDEHEQKNVKNCKILIEQCDRCALPCIVEPLPGNPFLDPKEQAKLLTEAAVRARDWGADALKIPYTGDMETFSELVRAVGIPVLVLGGEKTDTIGPALELARAALEAGAAGVVFGRQVIMADDPGHVVEELKRIIHPSL